jgi:S1-C subfamily serine protease
VGTLWEFGNVGTRVQITAGLLPGSSGGPVLNAQGQVVAIAAMHLDSEDELNFAVPAVQLRPLVIAAKLTR